MKKNIHPKYTKIKAQCSCNYTIYTRSTLNHNLNLDICSFCHPFYTGTQRTIDTKGRVNSFNKKFNFANNKFTFSKKQTKL